MRSMYRIKEMLTEELEKIAGKGELSAGTLEALHKLTDTIKNIDKIEMLEGEGGHSEAGYSSRAMEPGYAGIRGYSRDGGSSYESGGSYGGGSSYESGGSYARGGRHYVRGHYSRDDGREQMMEQLEGMMRNAGSEKEREAIRRCMEQLRGA